MKLSKVALSVIALLGIAELGGTYYTGTQLEGKYQEYINKANNELKTLRAYNIEAKFENFKLDRHFFSSDAEYQFTLNKIDSSNSEDKIILKGKEKLNHGPFPLNNIIKGKLSPQMISSATTLYMPEKLKSASKEGVLLTGITDISYNEAIQSELNTKEINYKDNNAELEIKPANIKIESDNKNISINTILHSLSIKDKNQKPILLAKNITYKADTNKSEFTNLQLGNGKLKSELIQVNTEEGYIASIKNLITTSLNEIKNKKIVSNSKTSLEVELQNGEKIQNLGTFNLDADVIGDPKSWNDFVEKIKTQNISSDEKMGYEAVKAIAEGLIFKINDFSLKNKAGKNTLILDINLKKFNPDLLLNTKDALNIFQKSSLDIILNLPTTRLMLEQINQLDMNEEEAKLTAQQALDQIIYPMQQQGLAYIENEDAKLKLVIDNGKIFFNNKELSEKDLNNLLFLLMISMGTGFSH